VALARPGLEAVDGSRQRSVVGEDGFDARV